MTKKRIHRYNPKWIPRKEREMYYLYILPNLYLYLIIKRQNFSPPIWFFYFSLEYVSVRVVFSGSFCSSCFLFYHVPLCTLPSYQIFIQPINSAWSACFTVSVSFSSSVFFLPVYTVSSGPYS
jgi:hypothetical protein